MGTNDYLTRVASGEDSSIFITSAGTGKTRLALFLSISESANIEVGVHGDEWRIQSQTAR